MADTQNAKPNLLGTKERRQLLVMIVTLAFITTVLLNERISWSHYSNKVRLNLSANISLDFCPSYHLKVDPFDAFVVPYLKPKKLACPQEEVLTFVDQEKGLLLLAPKVAQNVTCYFSWIQMKFSQSLVYSQTMVIPMNGVHFSRENFVANVSCYGANLSTSSSAPGPVYKNTHLWVPDFPKSNATGPSICILVLESLSRFSFDRFMTKTRAALDRLGNVQVMRGLNKVAENSFPNSMALIAGNTGEDKVKPDSYDNWLPYVWEQFKAKGYVTGLAEDAITLGLFTYNAPGFKQPPTDYFSAPFWLHLLQKYDLYQIMDNETLYCFHKSGSVFETFLGQTKQFVLKMQRQDQPYFMYSFASQMTHEDFNNFQLVDDPVANYLDWFKETPELLNNTVLIVMGDHGPRYGGLTNTPLGRLEARLPFFAIRVPEKLVEKHLHLPQILATNSDRLASWFDVHQLLFDVASDNYTQITSNRKDVTALSLWREEVPLDRTCRDANIPDKYCVCKEMVGDKPASDEKPAKKLVKIMASIVDHLCGITMTYNSTLMTIYILPEGNETFSSLEQIKLRVTTQPWDLRFEGLMIREDPAGQGKFSAWRMFDPQQKLNSFEQYLKSLPCTASALQSTLNIYFN